MKLDPAAAVSTSPMEELESRLLLSFDYNLGDFGPLHVAQGHDLWIIVSGQSPNPENECETIRLSTSAPTGLSATWPGNSFLWGPSMDEGTTLLMKISAASNAPLGATTVTVSGNSDNTHLIRTTSVDVIVDAMPTLSSPQFNCAPQPIYDANNPNAMADWEAAMITKGLQFSQQDYLDSLLCGGAAVQWGVWYYDGERVFYQVQDYTGDTTWTQRGADGVEAKYRPYVIGANGTFSQANVMFAQGLTMDYFRSTDATERDLDYSAVQMMAQNTNPWWSSAIDGGAMRETAFSIQSKTQARRMGITTNDFELHKQIDEGIGQLELLCIDGKFNFVEPFMVGLMANALIEWYDYTVEMHNQDSSFPIDTRIPGVIKYTADWLVGQTNGTWNAWDPEYTSFYYSMEYPNGVVDNSTAIIARSVDDIGLNNLITPMFGWLYHMYGETNGSTYRQWGDKIFGYGSKWDLFTGKQYSQNYRDTINYTQWRLNNDWANDSTVPVVSTFTEGTMDTTSKMYVTWKTNEATSSEVQYGLTTSYGSTLTNSMLVTSHRQEIKNLTAGATYHYRVKAVDASGNITYSPDRTFIAGQAATVLSISATDRDAYENSSDTGTFTITRSNSSGSLTVAYTITGSAANGSDYSSIASSVTFANGELSKTITITSVNDSSSEATEFVTLTLNEASGYDIDAASGNTTATVRIFDDENTLQSISVSVIDGTANENVAGDTAKWRLTRSSASGTMTVLVNVGSQYSTYVNNGTQYQSIPTSVTFNAGELTKDIVLTPINDDFLEGNVPIDLNVIEDAAVTYHIGSPSSGTIYLPGNDSIVSISASDASGSESGDGATFTITRTCYDSPSTAITVYYTIGGTATNGVDYSAIAGSVAFASGENTKTITIAPVQDGTTEEDETVVLTLTNPAGCQYGISGSAATVTIANVASVQSTVTVSVIDSTAIESTGDTGAWRISRSDVTGSLTVYYTITCEYGNYANNGSQYQLINTSVTFAAGEASKDVLLTPIDDDYLEGNVPVLLTLTADAGYIVGTPSSGYVSMPGNDSVVSVSATDATGWESGDTASFTITRTCYDSPSTAITVYYTLGGTASNGTDYSTIAGSVYFASDETSKIITVSPIQDTISESDETVVLTLTTSAGCQYNIYGPTAATATIVNVNVVHSTVTVSVPDNNANESVAGDTGKWRISRTDTTQALTVYYTITCQYGSYVNNGSQYQLIPTSVTFAAGEATKDVVVTPTDDDYLEGNVPLLLTLAPDANYIVGSPDSGYVYLPPNDSTVSITASDANASESGDTATFTITRSSYDNPATAMTVYYTIGGTASNGTDYTSIPASVQFAAGETSKTITVAPMRDALSEGDETVVLTLTNPAGCQYNISGSSIATATIANVVNATVNVSVVDSSANENVVGDTATWRITRSDTAGSLTVNYAISCDYSGYANDGTQYQLIPTSVTFADGEATKDVVLTPNNDDMLEGSIPMVLTLTSSEQYILGSSISGTVYMSTNDSRFSVSSSGTASESGTTASFVITRSYWDNQARTVYFTFGGTATSGSDYQGLAGSLTFAANESSKTITITPINDSLVEGTETVVLTLVTSSGCGYDLGTSSATVSILDND